MKIKFLLAFLLVFLQGFIPNMSLFSDEGMWLFNDPPTTLLSKKHNFNLTNPWLENACLSSVRFNNGGSGGFISADGLIITNHHIGAGQGHSGFGLGGAGTSGIFNPLCCCHG